MKNPKKFFQLLVLLLIVFSIPACKIREAEKEKAEEILERTDTDSDGLYDFEEVKFGTDRMKKDTDSDGLGDYEEVRKWNTDPNRMNTDGDAYPDGEEVELGYDPNSMTAQLDTDLDGLGNADEKKLGTDSQQADTDGDGMSDGEEVTAKRNPLEYDQ